MFDTENNDLIQSALRNCEEEPVHIPGRIQSHGALIAVDNVTFEIAYASSNTAEFLSVSPEDLLSRKLEEVFESKARHELANGMMIRETGQKSTDLGAIAFWDKTCVVTASGAGAYTIFEFESPTEDILSTGDGLKSLEFLVSEASRSPDRQSLFETSVTLLQMLTGYDSVLIYAFDDTGHGKVMAERTSVGRNSYLGLTFPSWDVPKQAREIMKKIPLRAIADTSGPTADVLAADPTLEPLDMTHGHLRATSPVHLQYLRNMNNKASMSLNLVVDGRLWGMISFYHRDVRYPSQRMRQMCRSFAEFFTLQLTSFEHAGRIERLNAADALRRKVVERGQSQGADQIFESALLEDLSETMQADGAALLYKGAIATSGVVPDYAALKEIFSGDPFSKKITATSSLAQDFPDLAARIGADIAGLLAAKLPDDCIFLFFRRAQDRVVNWAGAPTKEIEVDNGVGRLHPRGSFALYQETVRGTSAPWAAETLRMAEDLRSVLVAKEHADLIRKTNRQQSLLIDELNHRVRNILALIRSLSQQTLTHNGSIQSYVSALEARIAAVAAAHDLGAEKTDLSATLQQILEQEAGPYNQEQRRVLVTGDDSGIRPDLAPMFALVVHELMTNAVKYGALSNATGHVRIGCQKTDHGMLIEWREIDGPSVSKPAKKGFGTTLIEASVPFELDGEVAVDFAETGVVVSIRIPDSVLLDKTPLKALDIKRKSIFDSGTGAELKSVSQARCLLLEDNYVVSLDTVRVLREIGFTSVETSMNIADALAKVDTLCPDVAILDINLSAGQTSEPVAKLLSERGTPFIFVTGYGDTNKLDGDFEGAPVLKKPVHLDELRVALRELGL